MNSSVNFPFLNISSIPVYSEDILPRGMCSRYVRYAARDLFGIEYVGANAWDLHKHHLSRFKFEDLNVGADFISGEDLTYFESQIDEELGRNSVYQGDLIRFWNPNSKHRNRLLTHVALILNYSSDGSLELAHQYLGEFRRETIENSLRELNLRPFDILSPKRID